MSFARSASGVFAFALVVGGCTIASPTYITSHEGQADGGAAPASSATLNSTAAPSGGGATSCSGASFAKPDLSKLTACGNGLGHCWDKTKVAMADQFTACPSGTDVCIPDEILGAGGGKLKSCTSIVGPGGCVTATLIPAIVQQGGGALKPDVCSSTQLCVPCTDPTHGNAPTPFCQPIGVYDSACGAAAPSPSGSSTPPTQQACCTSNGHSNGVCIADSAVPAAERDQTTQDSCATGNACVPRSFVENKPQICNTSANERGVCMDRCFSSMLAFAGALGLFSQDWCGDTEICLPCSFVSGKGVPGCQ